MDWTEVRPAVGVVTAAQCCVVKMRLNSNLSLHGTSIFIVFFFFFSNYYLGKPRGRAALCLPRLINGLVMNPLASCLWFLLLIHRVGLSLSNTFWTWQLKALCEWIKQNGGKCWGSMSAGYVQAGHVLDPQIRGSQWNVHQDSLVKFSSGCSWKLDVTLKYINLALMEDCLLFATKEKNNRIRDYFAKGAKDSCKAKIKQNNHYPDLIISLYVSGGPALCIFK